MELPESHRDTTMFITSTASQQMVSSSGFPATSSSTANSSNPSSSSPSTSTSARASLINSSSDCTSRHSPYDKPITTSQDRDDGPVLRHSNDRQEDYDILFETGFSQDMMITDDLPEEADITAAHGYDPFSFSQMMMDTQQPDVQYPDLLLDDDIVAFDDTRSTSSSGLDYDADHEIYHELLDAPQSSKESYAQAPLSQTSLHELPDITNDELEAALEALNLYEPVIFPSEASNAQRRNIVKEKLCDFATSIIIQLTLSTTSDTVLLKGSMQIEESTQEGQESQYRALQAKIAKRTPKPSYDPIELKLRNRHGISQGVAFRTIRFPSTVASTRQLTVIMRLLDLLTDCLADETPSTLRDIYYRDVKLFGSQKVVDTLVDDIAATLGIRRRDLNVVAASKGLVHGYLQLQNDQGQIVECQNGSTGHLIPPNETIASMNVAPDVRFVLVVEKEAVFQSLCSSGFTNDSILGKSILITGKGYPDVATRELVKALCEKLPTSVPVLCFVDADPHGIHIFLNYRNGSKAMSFDNTNLIAPRIQWLGLSAEDMLQISAGEDSHLPLTPHDFKKGLSLLRMPDFDDDIRRHLQHLLHARVKAEIQMLHCGSENASGLLSCLRRKIAPRLTT